MKEEDQAKRATTAGRAGLEPDVLCLEPVQGLKGSTSVPGDKSISHRALILGVLSGGDVKVENLSPGEDVGSTRRCLVQLGASIRQGDAKGTWECSAGAFPREPQDVLDAGNSGTTMRLLAGLLAGQPFFSVLTGDESLRRRPMERIVIPLRQMGAEIRARENGRFPPLAIQGRALKSIRYDAPVASAQVKTALLLAGLGLPGETCFNEPYPSRDHTERMLRFMGADIRCEERTVCLRGAKPIHAGKLNVPGDPSSAAFLLVAALITQQSDLHIRGLCMNPTRIGYLNILERMGASIQRGAVQEISGEPVADLHVRSSRLKATSIGPEEVPSCIDEIPVLCVAAAFAQGTTAITGAKELRVKESDRIAAMASNLSRMGVTVKEKPDGLIIEGKGKIPAFEGESWQDHRVALSLMVAALAAEGTCRISGASSMNISFPGFLNSLEPLVSR